MKAYNQVRPDLADAAAVEAYVFTYPNDFTVGTSIFAADGSFSVVVFPGVTKLVPVEDPTPP